MTVRGGVPRRRSAEMPPSAVPDCSSAHASPAPESWATSGWKLGEVIGRGSYAAVHRATNSSTGRQAAVKVISKEHEDNTEESIESEVRILRAVSTSLRYSTHFVKLQAVYEDPWNVYLIMDLCPGGSLAERMAQKTLFSEGEAQQVARQLLTALHQLHALNLVHCDIKPENVLFPRLDSLQDLKITDFGLSQSAYVDTDYEVMGSPYYVAPEVLTRQLYSPNCDVWAIGILLYKMLCGRVPFPTNEKIKQNKLRFYDEVWADISQDAKSFLDKCLVKDPKARMSVSDLMQHPWLGATGEVALPATPPIKELPPLPRRMSAGDSNPSTPKPTTCASPKAPPGCTDEYTMSSDDDLDHWDIAARKWSSWSSPASPATPQSMPKANRTPGKSSRQARKLSIDRRLSLMLLGRGLR